MLLRNIPQVGTGLDPERLRPSSTWPPTCATEAGRARNSKRKGGEGGREGGGGGGSSGGGNGSGEGKEEEQVRGTSKRLPVGVLLRAEGLSRAGRPPRLGGVPGLRVGVLAGALTLITLLSLSTPTLAAVRVEDRAFWYAQARAQIRDNIEVHQVKGFAKNVILFVGDGMGVTSVTAARILRGQKAGQNGEEFRLAFEKFPHVAFAKTYNLDAQVGGSSACATALMCGVKANVNTVGLDFRGRFEDCASSYTARVSSLIDWAQKKDLCLSPFHEVGDDCIYVNHTFKLTWHKCRDFCGTLGGDLAVPSDALKLQQFLTSVSKGWTYWIGGSDLKEEGNWLWLDGRQVDLSAHWEEGEPNNHGGDEHCLHYYNSKPLVFNDVPCTFEHPCVCQNVIYPK